MSTEGMMNYPDDDPAAPATDDLIASTLDLTTAVGLTNFGAFDESDAETTLSITSRTLPIEIENARDFLNSCMNSSPRVGYGLGAKISPHGAVPGRDFTRVDCSGFVRETIWRATSPSMNFPDGSVVQHDWVRDQGFERGTSQDAMLEDGVIRIAFLRPQDAPSRIGHVALVFNASTLESHGQGVGPDSRAWSNTGWQAKAYVYVLRN